MCSLPEVVKQPGTLQALFKHLAASLNPSVSAPYLSASIVPQPPWYIIHRHTETRCTYHRANILPAYYLLPSRLLTPFNILLPFEKLRGLPWKRGEKAAKRILDGYADIIWRHTIQPYYKREVPPRTVICHHSLLTGPVPLLSV
ncbi:hypothetical protein C8R43DRAFT_943457 [Mycena crocata]|nr:hypothetical protein C8R43DRAFT_943457 [Mycena crocata]